MRPYIITHMGTSLDGRIDVEHWGDVQGIDEYERTGELLKGDAWIVGRVTMEMHFTSDQAVTLPPAQSKIEREDFVADHKANSFAVAVDASGKLFYDNAYIDDDHIIAVLTEKVSDAYLQYLKDNHVSYIFGGEKEIDFATVMEKLRRLFMIKRLLLEGGGGINGSVLNAGLVDEISLLLFPVVDGTVNTPSLFDAKTERWHLPARLEIISVQQLDHGIVWLRYKVK